MAHEFKDWFDEYELLPESEADLCSWNDEDVAFIKNDVHDGKSMWLIYAADGTKIAATDDRDFAFVMAKQNDFLSKSVLVCFEIGKSEPPFGARSSRTSSTLKLLRSGSQFCFSL